jgi:hypothetical protein
VAADLAALAWPLANGWQRLPHVRLVALSAADLRPFGYSMHSINSVIVQVVKEAVARLNV